MRVGARPILVGALCAFASSCAEEPVDDVAMSAPEIRGGRARDDHPEIGKMYQNIDGPNDWYSCTATLIDRKIAITAGHCVQHKNQDRPGNYGILEIRKQTSSGSIQTFRYQIDGYHNFDGLPHNYTGDPDDVGLIRLKTPVPCSVARPARLSRNGPPTGTVVSRWGYGVCAKEPSRKRVRHFRRGSKTAFLCPGDSGGPTLDPAGAVYQINSGRKTSGDMQDGVARVGKEWDGIHRMLAKWGRAGGCP
jgi:hypothetical protein